MNFKIGSCKLLLLYFSINYMKCYSIENYRSIILQKYNYMLQLGLVVELAIFINSETQFYASFQC